MHRAQVQERQGFEVASAGAGPAPSEPADRTSEIGDLWRILWCRRLVIAAAVAACTLAALIYVVVTPLQFTASAQILIDPRDRQILTKDVTPDTLAADGGVLQVESQSRVIESDAVLLRAVQALNLAADPDYGLPKTGLAAWIGGLLGDSGSDDPSADEDRALRALRRHLAVKRADKVFVVDIVFTAASGRKAARIADAIAEAYLADQTEARARSSSRASDALTSRLDELRAGVSAAADKVESFKVAHNLIGTDRQLISDQQLTDNGSQLDAARARVAELQARADQIDALRRSGLASGAMPEAVQSPVIAQLRASQAELVRKRSDMRTRFGDRYPDLIALNAEILQAHQQVEAELERLAHAAHSDLDRAKKNELALANAQSRLKLQTTSSDQARVTLRELDRELDARRAVYQSFLSRAGETREQSKIDNTNARIISRAIPPVQPSWPLRAILLLAGPAAGLGLGVALAFTLEYLAPTVLSASHLQGATGAPVVGVVPSRPERGTGVAWQARSSRHADLSGTAIRLGLSRICGPLARLQNRAKPHTLFVAAAARDVAGAEGHVAEALARAATEWGASTLLVDDPAVEVGAEGPRRGFLDVINGDCTMRSALLRDPETGSYRLPFGTSTAVRRGIPMERRFGSFLDEAARAFDLVIFDGTAFPDDGRTAPVAACVDDVLFVAQSGRTSQKEAYEAAEAIAASAGRPVSAAILLGGRDSA